MRPALTRTLLRLTLTIGLLASPLTGQPMPAPADKVVLVTLDGVRWQEVFRGADQRFFSPQAGVTDEEEVRGRYWSADEGTRRRMLMPFLWTTLVSQGQLWGDHDRQPEGTLVSNGRNFSYPGYNELLAGFPDDEIDSNRKIPNRNVSVLEWLENQKGLAEKTAAFGSWDVFPYILNGERSRLFINAGWQSYRPPHSDDPAITSMNQLQERSYREWQGVRFDNFTFTFALDYLEREKPSVLYIALGEPDDWAHARRYGNYLDAIHRNDAMLRDLWLALQASPEYRDRTALVITVDHGRGRSIEDWTDHGSEVPGSNEVWMAFLGSGVAPRRVRLDTGETRLAQIASTVAAALGLDFASSDPRIAGPLPVFELPSAAP